MRKWLHESFEVGIILKGIDGVLEVIGGLILALASSDRINHLVTFLTQHELSQDPHDFIANHLLNASHKLTPSASHFGAFYLLSHGAVKLILVIAILKQRLWAYPWMIGFLLVFIFYQIYRLGVHFSIGLLALTIFDAIIAALTVYEYRSLKEKLTS